MWNGSPERVKSPVSVPDTGSALVTKGIATRQMTIIRRLLERRWLFMAEKMVRGS